MNELHCLSLHPVISLPTRVTDTSTSLIDNFLCDFSLLPIESNVIKIDLSDHYMIQLKIDVSASTGEFIKRDSALKNKLIFTNKLCAANWEHLYTIADTDKAFNYFLKKLKRIYNKSFPYKVFSIHQNKNSWFTSAILKSIKHKNKLFRCMGSDNILQQEYRNYKNLLTKIIRAAKYNYHKNLLSNLKNKSSKLWSHLNSLINYNKIKSVSLEPNELNDFFY